MKVVTKIADAREEVRRARMGTRDRKVGFVPTMGALHEGHMSLVRKSVADGCWTVVSIYVNPSQFGRGEDFDKYPRPLERDLALCEGAGVDLVFAPADEEMYAPGHCSWIDVEGLTERLCGAFRPGHFRGVATIVAKLFAIILPDRAYFGRKDYQQLKVVERMTADLNLPVEIVGLPIVRDEDGIALSSRNSYLSPSERERARAIPRVLAKVASRWQDGVRSVVDLFAGLREELEKSVDRVEYFGLFHPETLVELGSEDDPGTSPLVALAVRVGETRLIDNYRPGMDLPPRGVCC